MLSILLSLALCLGMCPPVALAATDNPAGTTVNVLAQGDSVFNNNGTIITNNGTITNNNATGIVENSAGTVRANHGIVYSNSGAVQENLNSTGISGSGLTPGKVYTIDGGVVQEGYDNTGINYYLIKLAGDTTHVALTAESSGLEGDEKQYVKTGSIATLTADDGYVIRSASAGNVAGAVAADGKTCTFTFSTVSVVVEVTAQVEAAPADPADAVAAVAANDGKTTFLDEAGFVEAFTYSNTLSNLTLTLLRDAAVDGALYFHGRDITLDCGEHTLTGTGGMTIIINAGSFAVKNGTVENTGEHGNTSKQRRSRGR